MMQSPLVWGAVGGALIGLSASLLLLTHGKIAGVSGMLGGLLDPKAEGRSYGAWFLAGLLLMGLVLRFVRPELLAPKATSSLGLTAAAGLIVGFGTSLGNGCTSGHGVCGISRLSVRSILATVTFIVTGVVTVFLADHVLGGGQ
jgi:uncharacterized membrane protein YedE/YeeE